MSSIHLYSLVILLGGLMGFMFIFPSLLHWILLAEIIWVSLYMNLAGWGLTFDSLNFIIWAILLFCLSTSESALGLSLLLYNTILFNDFNGPQNMFNSIWRTQKYSSIPT